ncbi:MAG: type-F conjugative transfer system protein TraW [Woeseia sp.]
MKRLAAMILVFAMLMPAAALSEDLGVVGKTYEIAETDLLEHIEDQLRAMQADGRLAEQQQRLRERALATARRPPGRALPRASESRFFHVDPSVTTDYDVLDHRGNVIYKAGTTVNPLEYTTLSTPMVFFDGDDVKQATWVRAFLGDTPDRYVPLLTNGSAIELMQAWNIRLYFDQHGRYSERLGITALPAVVRQEGLLLRVDEIALEKS